MTTAARVFLIVVACCVVLTTATVGAAAAMIYRGGTIAVDVQDESGTDISVQVPAGLANMALALVPDRVVEEALDEAIAEVSREFDHDLEAWAPAFRKVWKAFADAPDFVMVEVEGGDEHVRIEKRDTELLILVDSDDGAVKIAVPLKTLRKVMQKF